MSWTLLLAIAAGAYLFKVVGVLVGDRLAASPTLEAFAGLVPAALLPALVVIQTFGDGDRLVVDARLPGVLVGSLAALRGAPFWLVVLLAAATTALVRLLT
jgi:branched-subunit amino acid transport protein